MKTHVPIGNIFIFLLAGHEVVFIIFYLFPIVTSFNVDYGTYSLFYSGTFGIASGSTRDPVSKYYERPP